MAPASVDSAQAALLDVVNQDMNDLFDAQRAYYREHRRFAPSLAELPGFARGAESGIRMTAGADWYVVLGGGPQSGVLQQVVYFRPADGEVARAGGAEGTQVMQTERIEGTMTRPR
jgi:hypothetical protein